MNDSLGDRMKAYENVFRYSLPDHLPVIVRVDGRAFHSYFKNCQKPFDNKLMAAMDSVALELCSEINNSVLAYVQSDEISILCYQKTKDSQAWFGNNLQKIVSIAASLASVKMTLLSPTIFDSIKPAQFDARAFVLPMHEVCNYYIWRQQDWIRNSVSMLARNHFSHKQLHNKTQSDMHEMLHQKGVNWANLDNSLKNGRCVIKETQFIKIPDKKLTIARPKWVIDDGVPVFTQNRQYIEARLT